MDSLSILVRCCRLCAFALSQVVIWLIPGVPVTINPRVSLEIRAAGVSAFAL